MLWLVVQISGLVFFNLVHPLFDGLNQSFLSGVWDSISTLKRKDKSKFSLDWNVVPTVPFLVHMFNKIKLMKHFGVNTSTEQVWRGWYEQCGDGVKGHVQQ